MIRDPSRKLNIGMAMPLDIKQQVIQLLQEYTDVFAWSPKDMPGIDEYVVVHKLNVDPFRNQ